MPAPEKAPSKRVLNMMKSMGYVPGRGLGKDEQGVTQAVQVEKRIGTAGLGFDHEAARKVHDENRKQKKCERQGFRRRMAEERAGQEATAETNTDAKYKSGVPRRSGSIKDNRNRARTATNVNSLTEEMNRLSLRSTPKEVPLPLGGSSSVTTPANTETATSTMDAGPPMPDATKKSGSLDPNNPIENMWYNLNVLSKRGYFDHL